MKKRFVLFRASLPVILLLAALSSCDVLEENPMLETAEATSVTRTSAMTGGYVAWYGDDPVTERGICYSAYGTPYITYPKIEMDGDTGFFHCRLSSLASGTTYHVRAYAINGSGTYYGNEVTFTTLAYDPIEFNPECTYGTVTDIDGNAYRTVEIGDQTWMAQNLRVTHYNDGTAIPHREGISVWAWNYLPGWCLYNDGGETYAETFGALYNWPAVNTGKLCPSGWHVSDNSEWEEMIAYLGGPLVAGGKLKEAGYAHWQHPNLAATNESGFTALPGGSRWVGGESYGIETYAAFWSADTSDRGGGACWHLHYYFGGNSIEGSGINPRYGYSVRCVKDE